VQRPATDGSGSDSENRRFKVDIKHVAEIDLELVMEHCRPERGTPQEEENMLTGQLPIPS
jgi:eukaryotic translation initiation factor 2C